MDPSYPVLTNESLNPSYPVPLDMNATAMVPPAATNATATLPPASNATATLPPASNATATLPPAASDATATLPPASSDATATLPPASNATATLPPAPATDAPVAEATPPPPASNASAPAATNGSAPVLPPATGNASLPPPPPAAANVSASAIEPGTIVPPMAFRNAPAPGAGTLLDPAAPAPLAVEVTNASEPASAGPTRVWYVCRGPQFVPRTEAETLSGVSRVNVMDCTAEMALEDLCCAPWATDVEFPRKHVGVVLEAAQEAPGSALAMINDEAADTSAEIMIFCTQPTEAGTIALEEGAAAAQIATECFSRMFSVAEIQGVGPGTPGQLLLEQRQAYLIAQGVPAAAVPTCSATVEKCPNGNPPVTLAGNTAAPAADPAATAFLRRTGRIQPAAVMTPGTLTILPAA